MIFIDQQQAQREKQCRDRQVSQRSNDRPEVASGDVCISDVSRQDASKGDPLTQAVGLLSQQAWCWGRDIMRPEGNWLLEIGFNRLEPPADRKDCSSVYVLDLPKRRCVVLRGFGVFYGDHQRGGVFLPRYEFQPRFTKQGTLACPPWSNKDLPKLRPPRRSQRDVCAALTLALIDWIRQYEVTITEQLGIDYRRTTLLNWDDGENSFTPAEAFASAWRKMSFHLAENPGAYLGLNDQRS
ncbi:hypothetical protein [Roseiconus lacunae]|uniref:Uncharacterized protein n=1 Tax=Roseiconus lacunae TaxID=2605694 RepID=A0ABT7PGS5_9BACT|nr:hypothetical protein [Roseiconus lacunae]MDM4015678.1 hypothetical protein [Roseiconus lacunae]